MAAPAVAAKPAPARRPLHFNSIDEILAELDILKRGPRTTTGAWSGGQNFEHLARFVDCSLDGFPMTLPWWMRLAGRLFKKKALQGPFPAGYKNKGAAADAFHPGETNWEDGMAHYRRSLARLKSESQRHPSPLFGDLARDEWDQLHCRHAELHLSFINA
jgi:hypothetical protein